MGVCIHGNSHSLIVLNHYAPSGPHVQHQRARYYQALEREINAQGKRPLMVGGDWNEDLGKMSMIAALEARGWRVPQRLDMHGQGAQATFRQGRYQSLLDGWVASPEIQGGAWTQHVRFIGHMSHATVTCILQQMTKGEAWPRVSNPPQLLLKQQGQQERGENGRDR